MPRWLLLVPTAVMLGGAASGPSGCPTVPLHGQTATLPSPVELGGRPSGATDLATVGLSGVTGVCGGPTTPLPPQGGGFSDTNADIVHSLPLPDILKPPRDPHEMRPEFGN
jgi:hypothetical protein